MMSIFYQHNILMINFANQKVNRVGRNHEIVWLQTDDNIVGINIFQADRFFPNLPTGYLYPTHEILTKIHALTHTNYVPEPTIVVAKIIECDDIPGTHLHKCLVDVGESAPKQIVCGAQNARKGLVTVCALPGTTLPNGTIINPGALMGIESQGMLCSAQELHLARESQGIVELRDDLTPGTRFDPVFQNLGHEEQFFPAENS